MIYIMYLDVDTPTSIAHLGSLLSSHPGAAQHFFASLNLFEHGSSDLSSLKSVTLLAISRNP